MREEKNTQFDGKKIIHVVRHAIMELLTTVCVSACNTGQDTLWHNIPVPALWTLLCL